MMTMNQSISVGTSVNANGDQKRIAQEKPLILPKFGELQLIGDSLLVCFADQILKQHYEIKQGSRTIGYCVSGQGIDQLRQRIKLKSYPLSPKVMLLIGTADVLCGGNINTMTKHFNALLVLLQKYVEKLLILTVPPIPKLCATYYHWSLIRQYNSFLKSLDNGRNIKVADICPIFTKFRGALEYEINVSREPLSEPAHRRKSLINYRRKSFYEQRQRFSADGRSCVASDRSESDYRNTTDTNTSLDSEILSSELSQEKESLPATDATDACEPSVKVASKRCTERVQSPVRFVVRTLQSVFGKDMLSRKKATMEEKKTKANLVEQPEKRPRKSPIDLNENLYASDGWKVESDEDSMNEHVYKSQEEIEYDLADVSSQRKEKRSGEFSKFVESLNENEETPQKGFGCVKSKRDYIRNEELEDTESSSSSDTDSPKKQIYPFVDQNFRYFLEKSQVLGESECSMDSGISSFCSPGALNQSLNHSYSSGDGSPGYGTPPGSEFNRSRNHSRKILQESRGYKNISGISERDKLILQLASKICHLECYELFYKWGKKRMDMIHLNYRGLTELKKFLVTNNYV